MKKFIILTTIIVLILSFSVVSFAHSGRTDSNGGHMNHSTGEYHYHHGKPAHQHSNGRCPYDDDSVETNYSSVVNTPSSISHTNSDDDDDKPFGFVGTILISALDSLLVFFPVYLLLSGLLGALFPNHKLSDNALMLISATLVFGYFVYYFS